LGGKLLRGKCFFSAKCSPCAVNQHASWLLAVAVQWLQPASLICL